MFAAQGAINDAVALDLASTTKRSRPVSSSSSNALNKTKSREFFLPDITKPKTPLNTNLNQTLSQSDLDDNDLVNEFQLTVNHIPEKVKPLVAILNSCRSSLSLLSMLDPSILDDPNISTSDPESASFLQALREHFLLESQYKQVRFEYAQIQDEQLSKQEKDIVDSESVSELIEEDLNEKIKLIQELEDCLTDSVKTLIRGFKRTPKIVGRIKELYHLQDEQQHKSKLNSNHKFLNYFTRLANLLTYSLSLTPDQEQAHYSQIDDLNQKYNAEYEKFQNLTTKLNSLNYENSQILSVKNQRIQHLKEQISSFIKTIQLNSSEFNSKILQEFEQSEQEYKQVIGALQQELGQLTGNLELNLDNHYRSELGGHRKKNFRSSDILSLIDKYDSHMQVKHESKNELADIHSREQKELYELSGYFANIDEREEKLRQEYEQLIQNRNDQIEADQKQQQAKLLTKEMFLQYYNKVKPKEKKVAKKKKYKTLPRPISEKKSRQTTANTNKQNEDSNNPTQSNSLESP